MCFCAEASFVGGTVLCIAGVVAVKMVTVKSRLLFASIPLFFSFQQFSEGFVWLALTKPEFAFMLKISTYSFLLIALIIWPIIVPLSIRLLEENVKRKIIMNILTGMGMLMSVYMTYTLFFREIGVSIMSHHIHYDVNYPYVFMDYSGIFYFIPTVIPSFISSVKKMKLFGGFLFVSYLITVYFLMEYVISIWCFAASIISLSIIFIISGLRKTSSDIEII